MTSSATAVLAQELAPASPVMTAAELIDMIDENNLKMTAAKGIVDCVRVLSGGGGVVAGNEVIETSMPDALYQVLELLRRVQASNDTIADALLHRLRAEPV